MLTAAAVLGPLEQARLQTVASLNKHVGLGAWFAAIAAGYAVDRFIAAAPAGRTRAVTVRRLRGRAGLPGRAGGQPVAGVLHRLAQRVQLHRDIPPAGRSRQTGTCWSRIASIARYYLPAGSQWQRWSSTRNIVLPSGASTGGPSSAAGVTGAGNAGVFAEFITRGYFSYVALNFADTTALDRQITADLRREPPLPHHRRRPLRHRDPAHRPGHLRHLAIRAVSTTKPSPLTPSASTTVTAGTPRPQPSLTLPPPPSDGEKYAYIHRNLPYLTITLVVSATCLIISQIRFELHDLALWPFLAFTATYVIYQVISLPVNFTGRGFDLAAHQARIEAWHPAQLSQRRHLPADLR